MIADPDHPQSSARLAALHAEQRRYRSNRGFGPVVVVSVALLALVGWNAHPVAGVVAPALFLGLVAGLVGLRRAARAPSSDRVERAGAAAVRARHSRWRRAIPANRMIGAAGWFLLAVAAAEAIVRFDQVDRESNPLTVLVALTAAGALLVSSSALVELRSGRSSSSLVARRRDTVRLLVRLGSTLIGLGGLVVSAWWLRGSGLVEPTVGTALLLVGAASTTVAVTLDRRDRRRRRMATPSAGS